MVVLAVIGFWIEAPWWLATCFFLIVICTFLALRANEHQIKQLHEQECDPSCISFGGSFLYMAAYYSPLAFIVFYHFFNALEIGPASFAAALVLVLILRVYLFPLLMTPSLTRYPEKENRLKQIAGDLMSRAESMKCPVMVADRFKTVEDDEEEEQESDEPELNAFACGIRKSRRIVIYSDLMDHYSDQAIRGVLAHEIAHIYHRHILQKLYIGMPLWAGLILYMRSNSPYQWTVFGIGMAGLLVFIKKLSRIHEYQADRKAAEWVGSETMLETFDNFGEDYDGNWLDRLLWSHPNHQQRKDAILKLNHV